MHNKVLIMVETNRDTKRDQIANFCLTELRDQLLFSKFMAWLNRLDEHLFWLEWSI